jgi:bacteriorhodopsin
MSLSVSQTIGMILQIVLLLWIIYFAVWVVIKSEGNLRKFAISTLPIGALLGILSIWLATQC